MDTTDLRANAISAFNAERAKIGLPPLTARQEHLVREFTDDNGKISAKDVALFRQLLESNSA